MPNHRNIYIALATSMSKTGKFQLTPLESDCVEVVTITKHLVQLTWGE